MYIYIYMYKCMTPRDLLEKYRHLHLIVKKNQCMNLPDLSSKPG